MVEIVRVDSNYDDDEGLLHMFCEAANLDTERASTNIESDSWETRPETLLNQIYKQKTYDEGGYFVLRKGERFVAGLGIYPFEHDNNILVFGSRMYADHRDSVFAKHRNISYITSKEIFNHFYDYRAWVGFINEWNEHRIEFALNGGRQKSSREWQHFNNLDHQILVYPHKVNYKNTIQTCIYNDYNYDYEKEILQCLKNIQSDIQ